MHVSAEKKLFNDRAAKTEALVSIPKILKMPASRYEYTGGSSAEEPVSAKWAAEAVAGDDGPRDQSEGPVLKNKGIHPVAVDKWNDRQSNGERDKNHQNIRASLRAGLD